MKSLVLLPFLFLVITTQVWAQKSGVWSVSDTSYAIYNGSEGIASAGKESVVLIADDPTQPYKLKRTTDGGKSWQWLYNLSNNHKPESIAHPNKDLIIVTGDTTEFLGVENHNSIIKYYGFISTSSDGGQTWNKTVIDSNCHVYSLSMYDNNNGIALKGMIGYKYSNITYYYDTLLVTNNCWKSYSKVVLPDTLKSNSLTYCFSKDIFYVQNTNWTDKRTYLYKTFDGGQNWEKIEIPGSGNIAFIDKDRAWTCGSEKYKGGNRPAIYKTVNCFKDYTVYYTESRYLLSNINGLYDISFADENNGIAVGSSSQIFRTEDGGETWWQEDLPYVKGLSLMYDSFGGVKFVAPDLAITTQWNSVILKYEGEKTLAAPYLIKPNIRMYDSDIPVRFTKVEGAESYHLQVAKDNSGVYNTGCYNKNMIMDTILTDTVVIIPEAEYNSAYYVRVKAQNASLESQWRERAPLFATIKDYTYIPEPVFISPSYNEEVPADYINLIWSNPEARAGMSYTYDLQVDSLSTFTNPIIGKSGVTDTTSYLSGQLTPGKRYFARVRVNSDTKQSLWTATSFYLINPTSVEEKEEVDAGMSIYPNPAKDKVYIQTLNLRDNEVKVYNMLGSLVLSQKAESSETLINIEALTPGMYFVRTGGKAAMFIRE